MDRSRIRGAKTTSIRLGALGLLAAITLGALPAARGQDEKFDIQVWSIRATKSNNDVSPELKSIVADLKKATGCTGFKLEKSESGVAKKGATYTSQSVGTYRMSVTPKERRANRITLQCQLVRKAQPKPKEPEKRDPEKPKDEDEKMVDTTITIDSGKTQPIAAPYPGGGEDKLVIAISAK